MTNVVFKEKLLSLTDVVDTNCGGISNHPTLLNLELNILRAGITMDTAMQKDFDAGQKVVREKYLAMMLIIHAEKDRFRDLQKELKMDYAKGFKNTFLTTVSDALDLLNHYKPSISNFKKRGTNRFCHQHQRQ